MIELREFRRSWPRCLDSAEIGTIEEPGVSAGPQLLDLPAGGIVLASRERLG